eukprot:CAMPEP_0170317298 /NCGR_PEP_ID=MMETSP0116_2-20130129/59317_1 /TAXON_ID=400756 /ORGANISM="Durinskia baltica, Strain CSIRO CS-38" /LENGTH=56 /DNA_ID=CAMNT_0010569937 /DNA_START=1 /DNA_END=167 /DNA_ORIENTATION=+
MPRADSGCSTGCQSPSSRWTNLTASSCRTGAALQAAQGSDRCARSGVGAPGRHPIS